MRRRGVRWFLLVAFIGSWIPWFGVHAAGGSLNDPAIQIATAAFMPALAAVVVRRWITKQGFKDSGLRLRVTSSWRHYVVAVTIPWGILAVAVAIAAVTGQWTPSSIDLDTTTWAYLAAGPLICVVTAPIFWGEEYGWTAYLRDRLVPGRPVATTFLTGVVWGVWHWPLPWVGYMGGDSNIADAVWAMVLWVPLCVLLEFLIGWLWSETGSVWPGAMLHAGNNLIASAGISFIFDDAIGATLGTILLCAGCVPFVLAVVLSGHTGGVATASMQGDSSR